MCCFLQCNDDHRECVLCGYAHFAMLLLLVSFQKLFRFILLQRDANADINSASTQNYVLPQVVIVGIYDKNYVPILYIVTEGSIICQLPQEKILDAVLGLLGSFYTSIMYTYTQWLGFSRADIA